jgi:TolB-like protein/tetratricopeptide (TPR) repeat protein
VSATPDIFLSYAREDQATARRFAEALEAEGFSVWWDQTLSAGEAFDEVTEKALKESRAVAVLWSTHSVSSRWVRAEAALADENGKLVPVLIESCEVPVKFRLTQTAEFINWKGNADEARWRRFVEGLSQKVGISGDARPVSSVPAARPTAPRRFAPLVAIAAAVLAAVAAGAWFLGRSSGETGEIRQVSVAVLPFVNLSGDPEQEYFSDGLTEEILNELAQIVDLKVSARTSSFAYKGKNEDVREIATALNVGNVLEGSIRRDGQSLRVTAQLIDGSDGAHRWSKTYDRQMSDVFAVQSELAADVARALSVKLEVADVSRTQGGTTNVEAYDRWLHGRALFAQGNQEALRQALELAREAVRLDPQFSLGWNQLYAVLINLGSASAAERAAFQEEAASAAARAVELAPDSWWGKGIQAGQFRGRHEWSAAVAAAEAAVEGPANAFNYNRAGPYQSVMVAVGRVRDAAREERKTLEVAPDNLVASQGLQRNLYVLGDVQGGEAEYERSLGLPGSSPIPHYLAFGRLLAGGEATPEQLRVPLERLEKSVNLPEALRSLLHESITDRAGTLKTLRSLIDASEYQVGFVLWSLAGLADALGDRELVARILSDPRFPEDAIWMLPYSGVRSDPAFKQKLRDMGLVDYWRESGNWGDFCEPVGDDDFECH